MNTTIIFPLFLAKFLTRHHNSIIILAPGSNLMIDPTIDPFVCMSTEARFHTDGREDNSGRVFALKKGIK